MKSHLESGDVDAALCPVLAIALPSEIESLAQAKVCDVEAICIGYLPSLPSLLCWTFSRLAHDLLAFFVLFQLTVQLLCNREFINFAPSIADLPEQENQLQSNSVPVPIICAKIE